MIDKILKRKSDQWIVDWDFVETIPEFAKLKEIEQSPEWHAEGNAWIHTQRVVSAAMDLCVREGLMKCDSKLLILSALFHDIGKINTTFTDKDGKIHSYGHEKESDKLTRKLLWEEKLATREEVCSCVRLHMECHNLKRQKQFPAFKKRIDYLKTNALKFEILAYLHYCDISGSMYDEEVKENDLYKANMLIAYANDCIALRHFFLNVCPPTSYVTLMVGLPGSGKSTMATSLAEKDGSVILSRDLIRAELGFCKEGDKVVCTREQEDEVTDIFEDRFVEAFNNHQNVIIDNINLRRSYRDNYKDLANGFNVHWTYVYCQAPSLEDNYKRRPMISKEVFNNMLNKFDYPEPSEYDMIVTV